MRIKELINSNGNKQKEVTIICLKNGTEIMTHYGTPIAGRVEGEFVKTDKHHSITSSKNINLYLEGTEAKVIPQVLLDKILSDI